MTATTAALTVFVPLVIATLVALAADTFAARKLALGVSVTALIIAAISGLFLGSTVAVADVLVVFRAGGPFSAVPGVIAACAAISLIGGWPSLSARDGGGTTAALVTLGAAAAGLMAAANDVTTLLIVVETSAVVAYTLVSTARTTRSDEAALKYFIQGSVATGFFILAMAVLVGLFAPSGRYAQLAATLAEPSLLGPALVGAVLVIAALAFKAGVAPLHSWAPDAYETAPVPAAAFLAAGPKLGAVAALALFVAVLDAGGIADQVVPILLALSMVSVLVGSLGALAQVSLRRMLAYAGIAQIGYALLAVAMLDPTSTVFFVSTYALATTGAFLAADAFSRERPQWDGTIAGLAGMGRIAPGVSAGLAVLLISLAGIPPLLGFWGKFQVFATAVYGAATALTLEPTGLTGWMLAVAVLVGLIGSVISLGYYGGVLRALYLSGAPDAEPLADGTPEGAQARGSGTSAVTVVSVAALVVILGVAPALWGYAVLLRPFVAR